MLATHRVKDSDNNSIGFIVDNFFYTDYYIKENIQYIDNLTVTKTGVIRAKKELQEIKYKEHIINNEYRRLVKENPFVRDIQKELLQWKKDRQHTVLQLEGSRQIGKTTELKKFAYKNYEYIVFIDLSNDIFKFIDAVNNGCTPIEIDKYCIRASLPHFVNSKDTILIIDEIQRNNTIYNSIRRLHDNLNCDIIVTGSYLGRILQADDFFLPAGTLSYAHMFTLSFSEFCRIFNSEKELINLDLFGNSDISTYGKLEKLYKIYLQIGGYPEVVKRYLETKSIPECYNILEKLLYTFKLESRVYFKQAREVEIFDCVYREALKQMCSRDNSGKQALGTLTALIKESTDLIVNKSEVANAVIWLQYAGIISTCNLALNGNLRNIKEDRKIYFTDCGIVSYLSSKSLLDKTSLAGLITETFVYNELHRLFKVPNTALKVSEDEVCFSTYNNYELDFLISDKAGIVYGIKVNNTDKLNIYKDNKHNTFTIPIYTVGCRFPYT